MKFCFSGTVTCQIGFMEIRPKAYFVVELTCGTKNIKKIVSSIFMGNMANSFITELIANSFNNTGMHLLNEQVNHKGTQ